MKAGLGLGAAFRSLSSSPCSIPARFYCVICIGACSGETHTHTSCTKPVGISASFHMSSTAKLQGSRLFTVHSASIIITAHPYAAKKTAQLLADLRPQTQQAKNLSPEPQSLKSRPHNSNLKTPWHLEPVLKAELTF